MDPEIREAIIVLLEAFGGNRSKVAKTLHVSRHTVAEVADSEKVQDNTEETEDPEEYSGEDNETKQEMDKMDALEKENQVLQSELDESKSEIERLIKNSERVWHQHQQQQQNSVSSKKAIMQDVLCKMLSEDKLPSSFFKYVDINRIPGKDRDREQSIYNVRRDMSENFLQLKYSLSTIESLITELSSAKDDEIKQACGAILRRTTWVTNELNSLSTIPINHPNLDIIPDEIAVKLHQDTTRLIDKVFPKLRPSVAVVRTSGKESKYFANIAAALGDLIRIISKIDTYFSRYLIDDNA